MRRTSLSRWLALLALLLVCGASNGRGAEGRPAAAGRKPKIVFILADDKY